jgi:hypothetical protein
MCEVSCALCGHRGRARLDPGETPAARLLRHQAHPACFVEVTRRRYGAREWVAACDGWPIRWMSEAGVPYERDAHAVAANTTSRSVVVRVADATAERPETVVDGYYAPYWAVWVCERLDDYALHATGLRHVTVVPPLARRAILKAWALLTDDERSQKKATLVEVFGVASAAYSLSGSYSAALGVVRAEMRAMGYLPPLRKRRADG